MDFFFVFFCGPVNRTGSPRDHFHYDGLVNKREIENNKNKQQGYGITAFPLSDIY